MDYKTEVVKLDPQFPFSVFTGAGFSARHHAMGLSFMHRHHSLEINYCTGGRGQYVIGDRTYEVCPGDLFLINDLEYHQAINLSGDLQLLVLVFDAELVLSGGEDYALIRAFYEWKHGFQHRFPAGSPIVESILPLIREMEQEWRQRQVGYLLVVKALLLKLLAMLYRGFERTEGYASGVRRFQTAYVRLAPAMALMDTAFSEPLTLGQLADTVHMNQNYFSSLFSSLMGYSVSEYLLRRRLRHATQLLISTDSSVLSIALDSGFRNVSYFNRAFKRQLGCTPGQFRSQVLDNR